MISATDRRSNCLTYMRHRRSWICSCLVINETGQQARLSTAEEVAAFETLGGVPCGQIRYDNLKPAVYRVCFGRNRIESQRWVAFRSH